MSGLDQHAAEKAATIKLVPWDNLIWQRFRQKATQMIEAVSVIGDIELRILEIYVTASKAFIMYPSSLEGAAHCSCVSFDLPSDSIRKSHAEESRQARAMAGKWLGLPTGDLEMRSIGVQLDAKATKTNTILLKLAVAALKVPGLREEVRAACLRQARWLEAQEASPIVNGVFWFSDDAGLRYAMDFTNMRAVVGAARHNADRWAPLRFNNLTEEFEFRSGWDGPWAESSSLLAAWAHFPFSPNSDLSKMLLRIARSVRPGQSLEPTMIPKIESLVRPEMPIVASPAPKQKSPAANITATNLRSLPGGTISPIKTRGSRAGAKQKDDSPPTKLRLLPPCP